MPVYHPSIPKAPEPTRILFDPFNSSSSGHQVDASRLSGTTSWRDSRSRKLGSQFGDVTGAGGQKHLSDTVGAGSVNWRKDGRKDNGSWEPGAPGLREKGWQDIRGLFGGSKKRKADDADSGSKGGTKRVCSEPPPANHTPGAITEGYTPLNEPDNPEKDTSVNSDDTVYPQIFRGLNIYVNGSTMPLVSDHRLKQLFHQYGGSSSIGLGRRTVTHVILGEQGKGGGLSGTKIHKENTNVRGKSIKYVSAQWVLDSIGKGIRQPESRYVAADVKNRLGGSGQGKFSSLFREHTR